MTDHAGAAAAQPDDAPPDAQAIAQARRVVAANSLDAQDCLELLAMLGITHLPADDALRVR
ncbi:hypothetical protein G4X40_11960 [Rhodococcus sp. D2-41]|uniref:hypothetical protein n=1 Tax=Speluncibacter jeojiensis TaxID=2710754 RepID=UPI00240F5173|nr:hypothetical protein [Rhodococcus sp. D2-41]MDG3010864.1 hypothetical protein [Rhodococcus sp. D2-41]